MPATPFPYVGAVAPLVTALVLWSVTGSSFALVGAFIAPTMVVAHFLDARRRARTEERARVASELRERTLRDEVKREHARLAVAEANRRHPAVGAIAAADDWVPARTGVTTVRAGHLADGSPWVVDLGGGVAISGDGVAGDAVVASLLVHATAALGVPTEGVGEWHWLNGARIVRGASESAALHIRCHGTRVVSIAARGELPESGKWFVDDVSQANSVLLRFRAEPTELPFVDRARCASGLGLTGSTPLHIDLSSDTPHVLIAGRTGSGKSVVFTTLIADWAERTMVRDLTVIGIDFKGGATLRQLEALPHLAAVVTDLDVGMVPRVLAGLAVELQRREREFARQRVSRIEDATGVPRLVIAIDEAQEFLRRHPEATELLADVARRGRSLGVHLVIAVQQASALRESILANIPVRIALAANSSHEVAQVVGRPISVVPSRGRAIVALGDGTVREVVVRSTTPVDIERISTGVGNPRNSPPWQQPVLPPIARGGNAGFGVLDDIANARVNPATWLPNDGDVMVVGDRGSGKSTAIEQLVAGHDVSRIASPNDLEGALRSIVLIDDLDRLLAGLTPRESDAFVTLLTKRRLELNASVFVYSARSLLPRITGTVSNVLTLRLPTIDEHRTTGASASTWSSVAAPGAGDWKGVRVVVYARTEAIETASIP
jgi:S-DNA-T family DNA segregation ATPase FtsK/SpoIIIE